MTVYGAGLLSYIWKIIEKGEPPPQLMCKRNEKADL